MKKNGYESALFPQCSIPALLVAAGIASLAIAGCESSSNTSGEGASCAVSEDCSGELECNAVQMCVEPHDPSPFEGCEGDCGAGASSNFGDVLAVYRGVPAFSNGQTYDCHPCADGAALGLSCGARCGYGTSSAQTPYGLAYQCVEYIRRFYATVYGDDVVGFSTGDADSYTGEKASWLGLTEYRNGQTGVLPQPDDIIVFDGGQYGHIGIVTRLDIEAGRVWLIQQNVMDSAIMSVGYRQVAGVVELDAPGAPLSGKVVRGWLRNPNHDFQVCGPTLPCPDGYTCEFGRCEAISCPNPVTTTGGISTPAPGSSQSSPFTVAGMVEDPNGITRVTAAVDTLSNCKFSVSLADPNTATYSYQIDVDPASCALQDGSHTVGIWVEDGCGLDTLVASVDFVYQTAECSPGTTCCDSSGSYIPSGQNGTGCNGDCSRCNGSGSCAYRPSGTSCGADGMCDGTGMCSEPICGDETIDPGEQCDGDNLGGATCQTMGYDDGALSCDAGCDYNTFGCYDEGIQANPSINSWTPSFQPDTNCTCSSNNTDCHTLYQGRVTSINGNTAQLEFRKVNPPGGAPSTTVSYWVAVGAATEPSCLDLNSFVSRASGTWVQGQVTRSVSVDIWPSQTAFDAAPCGETKKLFVITGGGGGHENERVWFQEQALIFTKTCT